MDPDKGTSLLGGEHAARKKSRRWEAISNLDEFFCKVYRYFEEGGFTRIVVSRIVNLFTVGFTIGFLFFLMIFVDFPSILSCVSEESCHDVHGIRSDVFANRPEAYVIFVITAFACFCSYWCWSFFRALYDIFFYAREMKRFYNKKLGIDEVALQTVRWSEVVDAVVALQRKVKMCIIKEELSTADIINRIMRKENFIIGIVNQNILNFELPFLPFLSDHCVITKTLMWNLNRALFDTMFDSNFCIRQDLTAERLQGSFRFLAVLNFVFSPFVLVYLLVEFFCKKFEVFHSHPGNIAMRAFSPHALYMFRELNEVSHLFKIRISPAYGCAAKYLACFPSPNTSTIARFVAYVSGSLLSVLIVLSLIDESILLHFKIADHNLLWCIAILSPVLVVARSLVAKKHHNKDPEEALRKVISHTHYEPAAWEGRFHSLDTRNQFMELYKLKISNFFHEIFSVLYTPFLLGFALPKRAEALVKHISEFKQMVEGVGHVYSPALFDFERHADPEFDPVGTITTTSQHDTDERRFRRETSKTIEGKMEMSFCSFKVNYPNYIPPHSGNFVSRVALQSSFLAGREDSLLTDAVGESDQLQDTRHMSESMSVPIANAQASRLLQIRRARRRLRQSLPPDQLL